MEPSASGMLDKHYTTLDTAPLLTFPVSIVLNKNKDLVFTAPRHSAYYLTIISSLSARNKRQDRGRLRRERSTKTKISNGGQTHSCLVCDFLKHFLATGDSFSESSASVLNPCEPLLFIFASVLSTLSCPKRASSPGAL